MKEKWHNVQDINNALGSDLDIDKSWEDFKKQKKKKRGHVWLLFVITFAMLFLSIYFLISVNTTNKPPIASNEINRNQVPTIESSNNNRTHKQEPTATISKNKFAASIKNLKSRTQNIIAKSSNEIKPNHLSQAKSKDVTDDKKLSSGDLLGVSDVKNVPNDNIEKDVNVNKISLLYITKIENLPFTNMIARSSSIVDIDIPIYKVNRAMENKGYYFGVRHTVGYIDRQLKGDSDYSALREKGENALEANHLQINIGRNIGRGFSITSGLTFGQYRTRIISEVQNVLSPVVFENRVIETLTQNGITQAVNGNAIGSQTILHRSVRYQFYQNISLPIYLGCSLKDNGKVSVSMNAGIEYGLYNQVLGYTYAPSNIGLPFVSISDLEYKGYGLVEGVVSADLKYAFYKDYYLTSGIQYRKDLNDRFGNSTMMSDRFSSYGLSLGLLRSF